MRGLTAAHDFLLAFGSGVRAAAGAVGRYAVMAGTAAAGEERPAGGFGGLQRHRGLVGAGGTAAEPALRAGRASRITLCRCATGAGGSSCRWRSRAGRGRPGLTTVMFCSWGRIVCWLRTTLSLRPLTVCCATLTPRWKFPLQMNCGAGCWMRLTISGGRAVRRRCGAAMVRRGAVRPAAIGRLVGRRCFCNSF